MRLNNIVRTATFRLASLYVLLFATSVIVVGVLAYSIISLALERRLEARVAGEMASLQTAYRSGGLSELETLVNARVRNRSEAALSYLIVDDKGHRLAGNLPHMPPKMGWSYVGVRESDGDFSDLRVLASPVDGQGRIAIAADREDIDEVEGFIFDGFVSAFGAVIVLGIIGGLALSAVFLKRIESIRATAEAIGAGDFSRRVPVRGTGDDLDRLSKTFNAMLDRIAELMESLDQVSVAIAHDLKAPLSRLRQRIEAVRSRSAPPDTAFVEGAAESIDEMLVTFDALLRIAQVESRTRRSGFRELNLSDVFSTIVEAFAPSVEEAGKTLVGHIAPGVRIAGDRELLTQMLANVVENAIRHTPAGTLIDVSLYKEEGGSIIGAVCDNGPGVPETERGRIFERLHRLEQSQSIPGAGLGLSLVKAVADLHGVALEVLDAKPGLKIVMRFPT